VIACPTRRGLTTPDGRCMGQKAVTRNLTGNPAQHSQERITAVKAQRNRRQTQPAKAG